MAKKKVIFIEDEPDMIMMVKIRLEALDYEVISANDGEEGLKKIREQKPDLVLLDLLLPKLDGFQVCKFLKDDSKTKDIPVIIITASGRKDIEEKCILAGADCCIRKPFDSQDLVAKVKELIT